MKRSFLWVLVSLLFLGFFSDALAKRSGGGFGRSTRSKPSVSAQYRAPGKTYAAPRRTYSNSRSGFPSFIFVPFFGFGHLGYAYSPFSFLGVLSLLLNLVVLAVVIAFVAWMVRRMRRA
ncbi:hypothetical protein [Deinococcus roseus]|nr:hypothetical protein [Deinococcus roseus]